MRVSHINIREAMVVYSTPWYLSGGIAASNCVAAYAPKGAASYAASKTNLANPGTHDAADGTHYPTWATGTGWKGDGSSAYLTTGIVPGSGWSMICNFASASPAGTFNAVAGLYHASGSRFYLSPSDSIDATLWGYGGSGGYLDHAPSTQSGCMALAGYRCFLNGTYVGNSASTSWNTETYQILLLARNSDPGGTTPANFTPAYVKSVAIYNTTLSDAQVSAVTSAMP